MLKVTKTLFKPSNSNLIENINTVFFDNCDINIDNMPIRGFPICVDTETVIFISCHPNFIHYCMTPIMFPNLKTAYINDYPTAYKHIHKFTTLKNIYFSTDYFKPDKYIHYTPPSYNCSKSNGNEYITLQYCDNVHFKTLQNISNTLE